MHRKVAFPVIRRFCPAVLILAALVLCALLPCSAAAQANITAPSEYSLHNVYRVGDRPQELVPLIHGWRFHRGDNPTYARPNFDDSSWQKATPYVNRPARAGVSWYRLHLVAPSHHGPLALAIYGLTGAYQIYVNGSLVPGARLLPVWRDRLGIQKVALPAVGNDWELAIRCVTPPMLAAHPPIWTVAVGTLPLVKAYGGGVTAAWILSDDASMGIEIACVFAGLALLGLFYFQRQHKEYVWLGLYLITLGSATAVLWASLTTLIPLSLLFLYSFPALSLAVLFQIEFTFAFVHQKVSRPWRAYELLLLISTVGSLVVALIGIDMHAEVQYLALQALTTLPAVLILPVLLWFWYRKGNREAGLLVIPSIFPGLALIFIEVGYLAQDGVVWSGLNMLRMPIQIGPLGFQLIDLSNFIFLLAIGAVIFLRFTEVSRAEARTAAELDAAREIQQTLVPTEPPAVEGYQLAAAYLPAAEVGGDFYQVLPQPDSGTIVALGDVSGKGLKAAMTGTLAIGALRTLAARGLSPAALLADLNEEIVAAQKGGFITMLCARIEVNGKITLANAGHLHPYRSGEEIELEAGLPLGVASGITYAEKQITLQPGERLTLISDGIVEARNNDGELFGFDRTQAGSGATAQQIAEAAQQFGQEDDITVLTLTREGATASKTVPLTTVPLPSPA